MTDRNEKNNHSEKKVDYGWRLKGKPLSDYHDNSIILDESKHIMQIALVEMSRKFYFVERCLQCGICTDSCPNTLLVSDGSFSPREFIQRLRLGLLDFSGDELWKCTNCGSCVLVCPFDIPLIDVLCDLRGLIFEQMAGYIPDSLKNSLTSIVSYYNPWQEDDKKRSDWLIPLDIELLDKNSSDGILLFTGCFASYDVNGKKIAQAAARILNRVGIDFDILGEREVCCGDALLRSGDFSGFERMRSINERSIRERGIKKIYTLSPHCFDFMNKRYFGEDEGFQIFPFVLLLKEIISCNLIKPERPINKSITFHDPCFLCMHNDIVSEFREIFERLPGVVLREMEHHGRKSICCGGGGGGIFHDREKGERLSEIRLEEAIKTEAEVLVTACPLCLSMLLSAADSDERFQNIEIMDLCELILLGIK